MGGVAFGPFLLEGRLASGGAAEVWIARPVDGDLPAPRLVVKRLLPSLLRDPEARAAFAKEAALYDHCRHPNVVDCFGAGMAGDEPWLALELVVGADLDTVFRASRKEERPLDPPVAVFVARELLAALGAVHEARGGDGRPLGILHRDVTPSNVFLSMDGDVKLGDFGIARYLTSPRTPAQLGVRGKFAYLAPEQVAAEPVDARTDLFSVANLLAEAMLGRRLFDGSGQLAVLLAVREARLDTLHTHGQHIPPSLRAVLERALAKRPDDRYPDARSFSEALAPHVADTFNAQRDLASRVAAARATSDELSAQIAADSTPILVSAPSMFPPAAPSTPPRAGAPTSGSAFAGHTTAEFRWPEASVRTTDGRALGPIAYAGLVELVAAGELSADDQVDLGEGFVALREIEGLAGHLGPRKTALQFVGTGTPDWCASANEPSDAHAGSDPGIAFALGWIAARAATGVLLVSSSTQRSEAYFRNGRLLVVPLAGSEAEAQSALVRLFGLREGDLAFYRGAEPDCDARQIMPLGSIIEAGVASVLDDDAAIERRRAWRAPLVALDVPASLRDAAWSRLVERVLESARTPLNPSALVDTFDEDPRDVVRAIESARLSRMLGIAASD